MLEEVFKSGRLEMSATPLADLADAGAWGDLTVNRILAVVAVGLMILSLPDLLRLVPHLLYSFDRSRGSVELEHSLGTARTRNVAALSFALPFCLLLDRYALVRPRFWEHIPASWSAPAVLGLLAAFRLCPCDRVVDIRFRLFVEHIKGKDRFVPGFAAALQLSAIHSEQCRILHDSA